MIKGDGWRLYRGDCLEVAETLEAGIGDLILTDFPYGTTACSWDTIIPFVPMWKMIKRLRKPRAAVVLFGSEPFSSQLRVSNLGEYKYDWVWEKDNGGNPLIAKYQPMKIHELISCFCTHNYYPEQIKVKKRMNRSGKNATASTSGVVVGKAKSDREGGYYRFPKTILKFNKPNNMHQYTLHPTQKPVALLRYLIRTYTNAGDTVVDFTMGSGSTGVAAILEGRKFIGIDNGYCEKEGLYNGWSWVDVAHERISNAAGEFTLTAKEKESGQMGLFGGDD